MTGKASTYAVDIDPDGHFELSFDVFSFMGGALVDHKQNWHEFIAQPGDTVDMTIHQDGSHSISLSDGREYLLAGYDRIAYGVKVMDHYKFMESKPTELERIQEYASECREKGQDYTAYIASKFHLSAFEYQYANIMMENDVLEYYLDRRMDIRREPISYLVGDNDEALLFL